MAAMAISQSSSFAPDSSKARGAAASIFAILDRKSKIDPSEESGMTPGSVKGEIEFRHVSFSYPTRPDVQILRDLCLSIRSGKVILLLLLLLYVECSGGSQLAQLHSDNVVVVDGADGCHSGRKWEWEVNSDIIAAKILQSGFRRDNNGRN